MPYELDRRPFSTNRISFLFMHNKVELYARVFPFIHGIFIYSGNLTLAVLYMSYFQTLFTFKCWTRVVGENIYFLTKVAVQNRFGSFYCTV